MAGNRVVNFPSAPDQFSRHFDNVGEKINASDVNNVQDAIVETQAYVIENTMNYRKTSMNRDTNGIYRIVEYKRPNGTLYMRSTLSDEVGGNYTTDTWTYFDSTGVIVVKETMWTLTYDNDGNVIDAAPN